MEAPAFIEAEVIQRIRGGRCGPYAPGLWASGTIAALSKLTLGVVGTRAASPFGKSLAFRFARAFADAGCCVISGLALGIDAAAHLGALEAASSGATIGVLGGGHSHFFPRRNKPLAQRMVERGGAVLSPFPPTQRPYASQFLQRNGVIAALCDALVVIEAPARSGALNTAGWAAGRIPVFAVPGDVDRAHVAGCHALIRDGAILARSPDDVLTELQVQPLGPVDPVPGALQQAGTEVERLILHVLSEGETGLDALVARVAREPQAILAALSLLELRGAIESRGSLRYALC